MSTPMQPEQPDTPAPGAPAPQGPPPGAAQAPAAPQIPPFDPGAGYAPAAGPAQPGSPQDWYAGQPVAPAPTATGGSSARLSIIFAIVIAALTPIFLVITNVLWNAMRDGDLSVMALALGITNIIQTLLVLILAALAIMFGVKAVRQNDRPVLGGIGAGAAGMAAIGSVFSLIPPFF